MYQPTEVMANIQITNISGNANDFKTISKDELVKLFLGKKVSLVELDTNNNIVHKIGESFYVQEIKPIYTKKELYVTLKIYSVDNLLKLHQSSRTFVAQRLITGILAGELNGVDTDKRYAGSPT